MPNNRRIVLASRPQGVASTSNFRLEEGPVPALEAGASSAGSTSVTLPEGLAAGTYFIVAKADDNNSVGEGSETNNTFAVTIRIVAAVGP
jgi:hypothetical protein